MNVIGIGTDITECDRVERMIERHPETFTDRIFTDTEQEYCRRGKQQIQHFTGRWAAKEAILKAIGTGWVRGIAWRDVEVVNEKSGRPIVNLYDGALEAARLRGIDEVLITISHCNSHAVAYALAIAHDR